MAIKKSKPKMIERIMNGIFAICGLAALAFVLIITLFLLVSGIPAIKEIGIVKFILGKV